MSPKIRYAGAVVLLAAVYFASAKVGLLAAVAQPVVSSAWPPTGIALAALLLFSVRLWPGITVGAFLLNFSAGVPLAGAAGIAVGNTLEAVVGALLLLRVAQFRASFERLRDVLTFLFFGALACTVVSATIGVTSLSLSGAISPGDGPLLWAVWCLGDAIGVLVVTPLLLTWAATPRIREPRGRAAEAAALLLALVVLTNLFFRSPVSYIYAIFPVVSWAALRFGPRGAATSSFLVSSMAIWYTVRGLGPFVGATPTQNLFLLQTFIALLAGTALVLAAVTTERKRVEEIHLVSEERYRLLFDANPQPMWLFDEETLRFLAVNDAACRHYGYSREEFLAMTIRDIRPSEDVPKLVRLLQSEPREYRELSGVRHRKKDGSLIDVEIASHSFVFDGRPVQLVLATDATERLRAEKEKGESEERYRVIFDASPFPMWLYETPSLKIGAVNQAAIDVYGYSREEFLGMTLHDLRTPEEGEHFRKMVADTPEPPVRWHAGIWVHRKKDGTPMDMDIHKHEVVVGGRSMRLSVQIDVTKQRRLEGQLRQSQKMEAIGQLAGGVAHDFNNLLTAILGYSDLLATEVGEKSPLLESIDEIRKAGERAASLTRQLLAFSRRQMLEPKVLDLNALIANVEKMLHRLIGEDVQLITVLDRVIGPVKADAGQIEQVILNLAINARDAMPKGGRLTIETQDVVLDEAYARERVAVRPGNYVMLAVTDTGIGMSAETKSHMFEPFFTTKAQGKGTGLGLATVYGIVKQSGGYVWFYSELGRGTAFKIYLPRVEAEVEVQRTVIAKAPAGGAETILLVEDEQSVRALIRKLLAGNGYTVLEAGGAEEALQTARQHSGPIHLLLTDVVMPEMGGSDLSARITAIRPETRVIFMSGYTDDAVVRQGLVAEGLNFLQKPFTPDALALKVRQVLDAA